MRFVVRSKGPRRPLSSSTNGVSPGSPPGVPLKARLRWDPIKFPSTWRSVAKFPLLSGNSFGRSPFLALRTRRSAPPPNVFCQTPYSGLPSNLGKEEPQNKSPEDTPTDPSLPKPLLPDPRSMNRSPSVDLRSVHESRATGSLSQAFLSPCSSPAYSAALFTKHILC